ncbi:MAG: hypothetical protein E6H09_05200 [Bacteroidetes bacterium]|nr:MAG: hypothetical protein E6H09_05200 [Bacteroidota bacterium]
MLACRVFLGHIVKGLIHFRDIYAVYLLAIIIAATETIVVTIGTHILERLPCRPLFLLGWIYTISFCFNWK